MKKHPDDMKDSHEENLDNCRLATPSPELKNRVLHAARDAWTEAGSLPLDVPWTVPVLRLAASVALAALLVLTANQAGRHAVARWQAFNQPTAAARFDAGSPYRAGWSSLLASARSQPGEDAAQNLLRRLDEVERMLAKSGGSSG